MPPNASEDDLGSGPDTAAVVRLLVALIGDDVASYAEAVSPPADLRRAVRCAPTPVLRGVLLDAVAELSRRSVPDQGA